jgi:hypothetical protein
MSKTGPGPMPAADPVREWAARPAGEPAVSGGLLGQQCLVTGEERGLTEAAWMEARRSSERGRAEMVVLELPAKGSWVVAADLLCRPRWHGGGRCSVTRRQCLRVWLKW